MQIFRCSQHLTLAARLLVAAIVLRSLIAPGFMLSVSADDGLNIVFCNGPVAVHAPDNGHSGHHHADTGETGKQAHVTPMCGHWSSSSHYVVTAFFAPSMDVPLPAKANTKYQSAPVQKFLDSPRVTRGPPSPV